MPNSPAAPVRSEYGRATENAYQELRRLLITGRIAPGTALIESELVARLKLGRTPIREALLRLTVEGLAVPLEGRKTRLMVPPLSTRTLKELYSIIGVLEGLAASNAALAAPESRAEVVHALGEIQRQFQERVGQATADEDSLFELHQAFHRSVTDRFSGSYMRNALEGVRTQVDRYEWLYGHLLHDRMADTLVEHEAIIQAIDHGDPVAAELAVRGNWNNAATRLARLLPRYARDPSGERLKMELI